MIELDGYVANPEIFINKIIKLKDVKAVTGLSRSSIYRRMGENLFPRSVSLGGKSVGWIEVEVQKWISDRIAERDA